MPDEPDPPRKFYQLGKAEFARANPEAGTPEAAAPQPDAKAILQGNLSRANAAGLNELVPKAKRASRRRRDFWILFLLGNGFFGGSLAYFGMTTIVGVFAVGGIIVFSCALTWVMWFIMEDY
jgi:hypothetical protein